MQKRYICYFGIILCRRTNKGSFHTFIFKAIILKLWQTFDSGLGGWASCKDFRTFTQKLPRYYYSQCNGDILLLL